MPHVIVMQKGLGSTLREHCPTEICLIRESANVHLQKEREEKRKKDVKKEERRKRKEETKGRKEGK